MRATPWLTGLTAGLLTLAPLGDAAVLEAQERPRVAVIPFDNQTGWWGRQLGSSAASQFTVELVNSGHFTVLERERVESVFDEWYLGQSGPVRPDQAAELGRLLGAQYLITGQFTNFNISRTGGSVRTRGPLGRVGANVTRAESAMNVRVINVTTGEIVAAAQASGNETLGGGFRTAEFEISQNMQWNPTIAEQALGPAVKQLVGDLVRQRDRLGGGGAAEARAPAIAGLGDGGTVYIDLGENAGISVGTRFRVLRVVDVIRDRDGNVLDEITDRVGVIEVTRVLSQSSICRVVEGDVREDDRLEPAS